MNKKIGLFFGTFNPIHNGHVEIGMCALNNLKLNEIWYIVTPFYGNKKKENLIEFKERVNLIRIIENKKIIAKDFEKHLSPPYYTINTLNFLKKLSHDFSIIMGEDNFENIHKWKSYKNILKDYKIIIYPREGHKIKNINKNSIKIIESEKINISSSFILNNFQDYSKIKNMINPKIYDYIKRKNLLKRQNTFK